MKKLLLFLLVIPFVSFAQFEKRIDSLKKVISSKIPAEKKIDSYKQLAEMYILQGNPEAKGVIEDMESKGKDASCDKCLAMSHYLKAKYNFSTGKKIEDIVSEFEKSTQFSDKANDFDFFSVVSNHEIQTLIAVGELDSAEKKILKLKNYFTKKNNFSYLDNVYFLYGKLYQTKGFNNLALDNYIKAYETLSKQKDGDPNSKIDYLNNIAMIYVDLLNYKKARQYNDTAIKLANSGTDVYNKILCEFHRGAIEFHAKDHNAAIKHYEKVYQLTEEIGNELYKSAAASYLCRSYFELKNIEKSRFYTNVAIEGFERLNNPPFFSAALLNRSRIAMAKNDFESARKDIERSKVVLADYVNTGDYLLIYDAEIEFYTKTKQFEKALKWSNELDSIEKKHTEKTNSTNLNEFETKYQTEKKEQQIKLLSTQNELAQKQKYIYFSLLGLLLLIGGSLFYAYRNKIKTAQKLNELNELKSRFFANISHEFRTPLTLIKSPVQSLQSEISDSGQKNKLKLIDTNSTRMLELVDQLLELSKIDSGNLKLILKSGNISSFLHSIVEPFVFQAKEKGIHFSSNIQNTTENNSYDKDVIEKIVTNLISNAFKYTPENESIAFNSSLVDSNLRLVISNSGSDLNNEDLPKLFERFYQKNEAKPGVGIGLTLVKELVDLYKGTIETSLHDSELSFIITLPLASANENAVVIPSTNESTAIANTTQDESELPVVLIVDDNAEIRSVLKDIFKNDYQIIEAQNGEEALKLAQKEIPDCIVSDVMMPKIDGFEFTRQIKNNELTSFIPVVLLTAKTSDEAHLEGLKSTADAFLTKPFNNEIVKATVQQLIGERKKLHERYSQELILKPLDIVINSAEEKFIEKLQNILDKNLSNSEFTAEYFASEIGMSRMQLHRKLKSLLGVSATEFLRNERLKVGAELLRKGNGNVSEIAYSVGFSDVSYFSKCFKEMYDCTPTEYMEK